MAAKNAPVYKFYILRVIYSVDVTETNKYEIK